MFTLLLSFFLFNLTLEEKVGQLIMAHFRNADEAKKLIDEAHIGVIYYNWSNGLTSPTETKELSEKLQQQSKIPLLIAIDQEGGNVSRFKEGGFTLFPGARAIGLTKEKISAVTPSFTSQQEVADRALTTLLKKEAPVLGDKIWKNECGGTIEGLVHWNKGEEFGSFGIGHFIWYPASQKSPFEETFPALLSFLKKEGVTIPDWLEKAEGCPWLSRDHFLKEIKSEKMIALKQFLFETIDKQALYIAYRLKEILPKMSEDLSSKDRALLKDNFYRLLNDPKGLYAMVDYLNFKGAGIVQAEQYNGKGWGLKQVLLLSQGKLPTFIEAAKKVLAERVENSPKERGESRWTAGWLARIETYR